MERNNPDAVIKYCAVTTRRGRRAGAGEWQVPPRCTQLKFCMNTCRDNRTNPI